MLYTIKNEYLQLTVDSFGAQMQSILGRDGCEYLWQGDPAYWGDRAPVLFPFIGRLEGKKYTCLGQAYSMGLHGFAKSSEFTLEQHTDDTLVLTLPSTLATRVIYPWEFVLEITYRLQANQIFIAHRVTNRSDSTMHFALGGHPGFRVPLEDGERFEDYYLEFSHKCRPDRVGLTVDTVLVDGQTAPYPLKGGNILPLRHDLFDTDAIVLQNMAHTVSLKSRTCRRSITVSYPQMPFLGFWHCGHKAAPYVCVEPWSSLPGRTGVIEEISCRSDFIHLESGRTYENILTVTVKED